MIRKRRSYSAAIVFILSATISLAYSADAVRKYENLTLEQINQLPKEEAESIPALVLVRRNLWGLDEPAYWIVVQSALRSLMYLNAGVTGETNRETVGAIERFQRDIGARQTGELTLGQMRALAERYDSLRSYKVFPSASKPFVSILQTVARAEGTWIIEATSDDEKIAYPVNQSVIICRRNIGICTEFQAALHYPKIGDGADAYLMADATDYDVTSWSDDEVTAELVGDCRRTTMTLNKRANEVVQINRNNSAADCSTALGMNVPRLAAPRVSRMVSGFEEAQKFFAARGKQTQAFFSAEWRALIESQRRK